MDVQEFFDQLLDERYKLEELIADKKYIASYVAYDTKQEQTVAIDILKAEYAENPQFLARFVERTHMLAQISHPNLPQLFHQGKLPDERPFVVREYIAGYPLTQRLDQLAKQGLPVYSVYALRIVRQIAEALATVEPLKLFHYALLPENILLKTFTVKSDDAVVILDMSIPELLTQPPTPASGGSSDPAPYLSPEQRLHEPCTARSHIYSLGVMLFELLTSQLPRQSEPFWQPLVRRLMQSRTPLEKVREDLAPETYQLIDRCLRREAWQRFPSLEMFIEGIDKAIMAEDVRIRTAADSVFVPRRNKRPFIALVSTIALIITLSLFWLRDVTSSNQPPTSNAETVAVITATPDNLPISIVTIATATQTAVATATSIASPTTEATATTTHTPTPTPTATATGTATPTFTPTPLPEIVVIFSSISVRTGPGVHYDVLGFLTEGETAVVIGRDDGNDVWYNILLPDNSPGWVAGNVVELVGGQNPAAIPTVATIPPSPTPTQTPTPTATPIPTATPAASGGGTGSGGGSSKPKPTSTAPPLP